MKRRSFLIGTAAILTAPLIGRAKPVEVYGKSESVKALDDIKAVNKLQSNFLKQYEENVRSAMSQPSSLREVIRGHGYEEGDIVTVTGSRGYDGEYRYVGSQWVNQ